MRDDREETIAFDMKYCQHYKPNGAKLTCVVGVDIYEKFDRKTPGIFNRIPCIDGHKRFDDPCSACDKWIRRTREMGEARADRVKKNFDSFILLQPILSEWRKKEPIGKAEIIECPSCKGKLHLSQAACNGHVHGRCETKDCFSWME